MTVTVVGMRFRVPHNAAFRAAELGVDVTAVLADRTVSVAFEEFGDELGLIDVGVGELDAETLDEVWVWMLVASGRPTAQTAEAARGFFELLFAGDELAGLTLALLGLRRMAALAATVAAVDEREALAVVLRLVVWSVPVAVSDVSSVVRSCDLVRAERWVVCGSSLLAELDDLLAVGDADRAFELACRQLPGELVRVRRLLTERYGHVEVVDWTFEELAAVSAELLTGSLLSHAGGRMAVELDGTVDAIVGRARALSGREDLTVDAAAALRLAQLHQQIERWRIDRTDEHGDAAVLEVCALTALLTADDQLAGLETLARFVGALAAHHQFAVRVAAAAGPDLVSMWAQATWEIDRDLAVICELRWLLLLASVQLAQEPADQRLSDLSGMWGAACVQALQGTSADRADLVAALAGTIPPIVCEFAPHAALGTRKSQLPAVVRRLHMLAAALRSDGDADTPASRRACADAHRILAEHVPGRVWDQFERFGGVRDNVTLEALTYASDVETRFVGRATMIAVSAGRLPGAAIPDDAERVVAWSLLTSQPELTRRAAQRLIALLIEWQLKLPEALAVAGAFEPGSLAATVGGWPSFTSMVRSVWSAGGEVARIAVLAEIAATTRQVFAQGGHVDHPAVRCADRLAVAGTAQPLTAHRFQEAIGELTGLLDETAGAAPLAAWVRQLTDEAWLYVTDADVEVDDPVALVPALARQCFMDDIVLTDVDQEMMRAAHRQHVSLGVSAADAAAAVAGGFVHHHVMLAGADGQRRRAVPVSAAALLLRDIGQPAGGGRLTGFACGFAFLDGALDKHRAFRAVQSLSASAAAWALAAEMWWLLRDATSPSLQVSTLFDEIDAALDRREFQRAALMAVKAAKAADVAAPGSELACQAWDAVAFYAAGPFARVS